MSADRPDQQQPPDIGTTIRRLIEQRRREQLDRLFRRGDDHVVDQGDDHVVDQGDADVDDRPPDAA